MKYGTPRNSIVSQLVLSTEYVDNAVEKLYHALLNRDADARGMQAWTAYYLAGHSTDDIRIQILASPEYQADHGGANGFLQALYQDVLHRDIDAGGAAYWSHALASGTSRQQVANALLHSAEAETSTVRNLYTQYLRRAGDDGGVDYFVSLMQHGARPEDVAMQMVASDEYFARP